MKINISTTTINSDKDYKTPINEIISSSSLAFLISPTRSKRLLIKLVWIIFLIGFLFGSIYYGYKQTGIIHFANQRKFKK